MARLTRNHTITSNHKLDRQMELVWNKINTELSKSNIKLINNYDSEMVNVGLSKATRLKHLQVILSLSRILHKNWNRCTKNDVSSLVRTIMDRYGDTNGTESETSRDFKKVLKIFFRWYKLGSRDYKDVGDPPETARIRMKRPKDKIVRESLLDDSDISRLLFACHGNLRDKAFLHVHYEAGTRPGEILSLLIRHVKFDDYGAIIHVDGKTGARPIRLVQSVPDLSAWINSHPFRNDSESPLWILMDSDNFGLSMTYTAAAQMVKRRCKSAQINKPVNLKLFRHSEATNTAKFLTESEMRKRHGWTNSSVMTAKYVHLVDSDVDEKILTHYGIMKNDAKSETKLPKKCPICNHINSHHSMMCSKCGKPLDLKTAADLDAKGQTIDEKLESLSKSIQENRQIMMAFSESFVNNPHKFTNNDEGYLITRVLKFMGEDRLYKQAQKKLEKLYVK